MALYFGLLIVLVQTLLLQLQHLQSIPQIRERFIGKRYYGYLQATLHHCICYTRNEELENGIAVSGHARGILPTMSEFKCYVDACYAGNEDTRRSTTGYMFKIGGSPVSWQSRMQTSVALSSMESEYMAASAAAQEALWQNGYFNN